jgi:hypothetical protein
MFNAFGGPADGPYLKNQDKYLIFTFLLDLKVFRKYVQIQGGKKILTAGIDGLFRGSKFFSNAGVGKINKNLNIEF